MRAGERASQVMNALLRAKLNKYVGNGVTHKMEVAN